MFILQSLEYTITIGLTIGLIIIITLLFRLYYKIKLTEKKITKLSREIQDKDIEKEEIINRLREIEDETIL